MNRARVETDRERDLQQYEENLAQTRGESGLWSECHCVAGRLCDFRVDLDAVRRGRAKLRCATPSAERLLLVRHGQPWARHAQSPPARREYQPAGRRGQRRHRLESRVAAGGVIGLVWWATGRCGDARLGRTERLPDDSAGIADCHGAAPEPLERDARGRHQQHSNLCPAHQGGRAERQKPRVRGRRTGAWSARFEDSVAAHPAKHRRAADRARHVRLRRGNIGRSRAELSGIGDSTRRALKRHDLVGRDAQRRADFHLLESVGDDLSGCDDCRDGAGTEPAG